MRYERYKPFSIVTPADGPRPGRQSTPGIETRPTTRATARTGPVGCTGLSRQPCARLQIQAQKPGEREKLRHQGRVFSGKLPPECQQQPPALDSSSACGHAHSVARGPSPASDHTGREDLAQPPAPSTYQETRELRPSTQPLRESPRAPLGCSSIRPDGRGPVPTRGRALGSVRSAART